MSADVVNLEANDVWYGDIELVRVVPVAKKESSALLATPGMFCMFDEDVIEAW